MRDKRSLQKERWPRIEEAFQRGVELSGAALEDFLSELASSDPELVTEVRSLLAVETGRVGELVAEAADELVQSALDAGDEERIAALRFGPYRAVELIGRGGMGAVYLGERVEGDFEQRVALKIVAQGPMGEDAHRRFREERRILAGLHHERIARLIDGGVADDGRTLWLAMEHVEGRSFREALAEAPVERRLACFLDVCEAVHYAHRNLVVHRDLKPSNILVDEEGRAKLLDFGIAKALAGREAGLADVETDSSSPSTPRSLTPAYAAPEQIRGSAVTVATDIYTLGLLLYEILAGRHAFEDQRRSGDLEAAILGTDPEPPSRAPARMVENGSGPLSSTLAHDLDLICLKALHRDPEQRYSTTAALAEDVRRALEDRPILAIPAPWAHRLRKLVRRHRPFVLLTTGASLTILCLTFYYGVHLTRERDLARHESRKATQIATFLTDLFAASDPSDVEGSRLTARELLDRGVRRIDHDLEDQPELRADLLRLMGEVHKRLGLYDSALRLLEQASQLEEQMDPLRAGARAETLFQIGEVHLYEERFDAAERALRSALEAQRRASGGAPAADVATTLDLLGRLERLRQRPEAAENLHQEAYEARLRLFGEGSLPVSESLQSLAMLHHQEGRPGEAVELLHQALEIRRRHLGSHHPETAELLQNLATSLQRLGRLEQALEVMTEALEAAAAAYGEEHQSVGWTLSGMAYSLQQLGRLDEALEHDRRAVEVFRRRGGGPAGMSSLVQLARHLTQAGELEQAEAAAREALEWLEDSPENPDPKRSNVLVDLGTILTLDGRYEEAGDALRETLRLDIATYGDDHPYVAQDRYKLGDLARRSGKPQEALRWLDLALERQRRLRPGANALGLTLIARGETLLLLAEPAEAEGMFQEALEVFAVETPEDHPDVSTARLGLGAALTAQGRRAEGQALMDAAIHDLEAKLGADSSRVREAKQRRR